MTDLPKAYTPRDVEGAIYERWLAADVFAPDGAGSTADPALPPFTIIQPPPNVTGSLHLGHAQRTAVEDLMIRHARMRGHAALFLPGLDHASIAAQFVLDGILAREGEDRQSLGRDRYLERMRAFSDSTRPVMLGQQRRVGASADWERLRYTMDDGSATAVRVAFERLYRDGLAYRTEALVNWCPGCRTSVSDLEVVPTPETGTLWSVRYHVIDDATGGPEAGAGPASTITVATTRPETILGDTAVAVHPDDERYAALIGRRVRIPFVDRDVPVIADDVVERAFGTGAVEDHARPTTRTTTRPACATVSRRPTILADDATIADTGTDYDGLDRYEARRRIVADARGTRRPRAARAPTRWSSDAASAATTSSSRGSRPSGSSGPSRSPRGPSTRRVGADPDPAGAVREDLGALADEHPRLERVAASCGGATGSPPGTAPTAT